MTEVTVTEDDLRRAYELFGFGGAAHRNHSLRARLDAVARAIAETRIESMQACRAFASDLLHANQRIAELEVENARLRDLLEAPAP